MESLGAIYRKAVEASGAVPQIMGVFGNCGGGLSVLTSVSDFTFMEKDAKLFLNTPNAIGGNREDKLDTAGADFQYSEAGNVDFVGTEQEIFAAMRQLVIMLPGCSLEDGRVDAVPGRSEPRLPKAWRTSSATLLPLRLRFPTIAYL